MNNRLYRDARRAFVSAATAYRIACDDHAPRSYAFGSHPCDGETIERDHRHFGYYYTTETWSEFWPAETVRAAREWLFDRMVSQMRDVFEYGACWVQVTAFDLETDEELASESCGGFDDVAYGVQDVFENCERAAQADYVGRL